MSGIFAGFLERVLTNPAGVSSIQSSLALREVKFSSRVPVPTHDRSCFQAPAHGHPLSIVIPWSATR
ncbi:hypothetical protein QZM72_06095 [Burkholderia sp. AU45388]|nr:hypothetical protein [Burkholderia sp. AU45388]MDN7425908.1 hypothetical protein [Burkholderia sp. AU45388]